MHGHAAASTDVVDRVSESNVNAIHSSGARMTLKKKLVLAFCALVVLLFVVGAAGVHDTRSINANTRDIATNWMPSVKVLASIRGALNTGRRVEADHLISGDNVKDRGERRKGSPRYATNSQR
ncbi:MAG TPA: MCP four helix bundle domain-containing protein [Paraburkholderia sp.]|uniref:MCP four helix bundle domain-containing protein n=1 Tax=Paraburkholderia sp. TaxID=1926495 RepID=UPI002BCDB54E|nr:MCP four helix bundle domain-containing protein [Paraburkholderia sp.]HTR05313.1 MCP four helix bundle domain-containing protein [Paraburkholderia sp.]